MKQTDLVRDFVVRTSVDPARRSGRTEFSVVAGEVHKALGFANRVPLVCQALRSKRWLTENGIELKNESGPPSGLGTKVVFTYRFLSKSSAAGPKGLLSLLGIGKDLWKDWGGGESFLKGEREQFEPRK